LTSDRQKFQLPVNESLLSIARTISYHLRLLSIELHAQLIAVETIVSVATRAVMETRKLAIGDQ